MKIYQLLLIGYIAEKEWVHSDSEQEKKELESKIAFATIDFCESQRQEEVVLIIIEGLTMF